jgi:hypothetical protein
LADQTTGIVVKDANVTATTWAPGQALTLGDNYKWWVGALQGHTIAWDSGHTFTIAPTAAGPSGTIATSMPTFIWTAVTGADHYYVWLADQTTGVVVKVPNASATTWTPTEDLTRGNTYVWWVGAINGNSIGWDSGVTFTI